MLLPSEQGRSVARRPDLLIVVGCVLAPQAGVAVWAHNQVTNTDRYVREDGDKDGQ
jgi:hypothetical protein